MDVTWKTCLSIQHTMHEEYQESLQGGEDTEEPLYHLGEGVVSNHKEAQSPAHTQDGHQHQRGMEKGAVWQEEEGIEERQRISLGGREGGRDREADRMAYQNRHVSRSFFLAALTMI